MKPTLLITSLIIVFSLSTAFNLSAFAQTQTGDTLYFNASWRDTTAVHASFYRVRVRQGAGWQVTDHYISGKIQMTGTFSDDSCKIRQGEFTYFDSTGLAFHRYSFKDNKENGKETYTWPNKKTMMTGSYKNGERDGEWIGYYRTGNAYKNKIEGIVVVQFIVDEDGNPTDIKVIKSSANGELDAEAKRVISESKDWVPAVYGGRFVKSYKKQPIVFKLQQS
jgi:TonB family protein